MSENASPIQTVGELIEALRKLPPRRFIMVPDKDGILSNILLVAEDDRVAEIRADVRTKR